ncbi:STAS domain-containing protein [Streptomyces clavifer]|uniref:STAS domain-containing protein n=1 Tax=Streptomyces clavifer TaxID=68188 RepID=UPI00332305A9
MRAARERDGVRDAMTIYPFTSHVVVRSGIARVTFAGELDLDTAPRVQDAVTACPERPPTSLCLDLTGVSFCDCAGLSALFRARTPALRAGVDLVVEGVGTQLARLLSRVGADGLFTARSTPPQAEPTAWAAADTATTRPDAAAAATAESLPPGLLT